MSWKPSQAIQLIENATDRPELTIVPIWSSDILNFYRMTPFQQTITSNKYEVSSLMNDPLDGTIMIVHHHNYLTALTVISVNNIQRDQLINHVVPSLENKGIVNYFGSMIPAYRHSVHIPNPTTKNTLLSRQSLPCRDRPDHEEYSKAEVNTCRKQFDPATICIHHDINQEGFSIELPSEWCMDTLEKRAMKSQQY
ncbi:hypothetical protein BDF22DRAFT_747034 [Syncephalis plumigaleata]|nr:hypothetical protein BDF22DRAFT_747034 [Syncephalis plumigaleata]